MLVIEYLFWNSGDNDNEILFFCSGSKFLSMLLLDVSFHSCGFLALPFVDRWGKYCKYCFSFVILPCLAPFFVCVLSVRQCCQPLDVYPKPLNSYEFSCETFSAWGKSTYNFCRTGKSYFFMRCQWNSW